MLHKIVIPHFNKYSLNSQKKADFILFSNAIDIIINSNNDINDIYRILSLKSSMGKKNGIPSILSDIFPNIEPAKRPIITSQKIKSVF
jgi:hypothetical protein